jgi:hypothetical protein
MSNSDAASAALSDANGNHPHMAFDDPFVLLIIHEPQVENQVEIVQGLLASALSALGIMVRS